MSDSRDAADAYIVCSSHLAGSVIGAADHLDLQSVAWSRSSSLRFVDLGLAGRMTEHDQLTTFSDRSLNDRSWCSLPFDSRKATGQQRAPIPGIVEANSLSRNLPFVEFAKRPAFTPRSPHSLTAPSKRQVVGAALCS